jgi:hypothetical protein
MRKLRIILFSLLFIFASQTKTGTTFDDAGDYPFINASNGAVEDGSFATATIPSDNNAAALKSNTYGFSIPEYARVDSLHVKVKHRQTVTTDAVLFAVQTDSFGTYAGGPAVPISPATGTVPTTLTWEEYSFHNGNCYIDARQYINTLSGVGLWYNTTDNVGAVIDVDAVQYIIYYTHGTDIIHGAGAVGADESNGGSTNWTNLSSARVADGVSASVALATGDVSYWLVASNFGFSIPAGDTIVQVIDEVKAYNPVLGRGDPFEWNAVSLKSGAYGSDYFTNPSTGQELSALTWRRVNDGGSGQLGWTVSELNDNDNGFAISVHAPNSETPDTMYVDAMRRVVDVISAGGGSTPTRYHIIGYAGHPEKNEIIKDN